MPAAPAASPAPACAGLAAGSWPRTACTHAQRLGSQALTWPVATQTAAVPVLSERWPGWLEVIGHELRCAAGWTPARSVDAAACMGQQCKLSHSVLCEGPWHLPSLEGICNSLLESVSLGESDYQGKKQQR